MGAFPSAAAFSLASVFARIIACASASYSAIDFSGPAGAAGLGAGFFAGPPGPRGRAGPRAREGGGLGRAPEGGGGGGFLGPPEGGGGGGLGFAPEGGGGGGRGGPLPAGPGAGGLGYTVAAA